MANSFKRLLKGGQRILIALILVLILVGISLFWETKSQKAKAELADFVLKVDSTDLILIQENSLLAVAEPTNSKPTEGKKINVVITAYSSTTWETDDDPYITAAGTWVREGVIANNLFPFGTKIKIPELFGDKVFVVEDRMNWKKDKYHIDIWFPDYWQALNFGAKRTYIEVLEG